MFSKIIKKRRLQKLRQGAIDKLWLTDDDMNNIIQIKYEDIYVVTSDFYEKNVKGKEQEVTRLLNCKSIAILFNSTYKDGVSFIHNAHTEAAVKGIESQGIKYTEQFPLPLGSGIYVWSINKPCSYSYANAFKISNYEGQYLQLIYFDNCRYDGINDTEYLLLKVCQKKNVLKI